MCADAAIYIGETQCLWAAIGSGALLGSKLLSSSALHVAGGAALGLGVLGAVVMKRRSMVAAHDAAGLPNRGG